MIEPVKPIRDERGHFLPGVSGNPKGPGKGYRKIAYKEMEDAINAFQEEHGVSYWKAAVLLSIKLAQAGNTTLLCKVLDKFIPSKVEVTETDAMDQLPFVVRGPASAN